MNPAEYKLFIEAVSMWFGTWRTWITMGAQARRRWYAEHWRVRP